MKMSIKSALASLVMAAFYTTSASAAVFVQAGAGHPHLSFGTVAWSGEGSATGWRIFDGRSIDPGTVEGGSPKTWDTPLPISVTNATWNAVARTSGTGSGNFTNRICSFTSSGAFSACGSAVAAGSTSSVVVPTDGSAYSQSVWSC